MINELSNEIFQKMLRMEIKKLKRKILKVENCPGLFRLWNKYKIELNAVRNLMIEYPSISVEEWTSLIKQNPNSLKFVNDCLVVVPDMLSMLLNNGYEEVLKEFYKRRRAELDKIKTNRGRKKTVAVESEQVEAECLDELNK